MFTNTTLALWLALFPLTYIAHVAEEFWVRGGYSNYLRERYSVELSPRRFLVLQSLGLSLVITGATLAITLRFPVTMLAMLSAITLGNSLVHIARSLRDGAYTPGLLTAVSLWLPLSITTVTTIWQALSGGKLLLGLFIGLFVNCLVELITFRSSGRSRSP